MVKRPNNAAPMGGKNKEGTGNTADFNSTIERTFEFDEAQQKYSHHSEPHAVMGESLGYTGGSHSGNVKRVVVARPVVEAWQSPDGKGSFAAELEMKVAPQNLVLGGPAGVRRGIDGHVLPHSILGAWQDFEERAPKEDFGEEHAQVALPPKYEEEDDEGSVYSKTQSIRSGASKKIEGSRRGSADNRSQKSGHGSQKGSVKAVSQAGGMEQEPEKSYYERSADLRQTKALDRFEYYEKARLQMYQRFKLERRGMKSTAGEPVMFSGDEHRQRKEEYDLIDKAQPREEKFQDSLWFMSLRDSWCRYIPLGSIFSCLFCKVRESDISEKAFTVIRNPRRPDLINTKHPKSTLRDGTEYTYHTQNSVDSIPKLSWVNDEHMWEKEHAYRKEVSILLPFRVDAEGMEILGRDIWTKGELPVEGLSNYPKESEEHEVGDAAEMQSIHSARTGSKHGLDISGVSGPNVIFHENHLAFDTSPGKINSQRLSVENAGTTAIYYKWQKAEQTNTLGVPLRGIVPPGGGFYTSDEEGVLLPGNIMEFSFAFKSTLCGIYTSSFSMKTVPPLPEGTAPLIVNLRGVVTSPDNNVIKRTLLDQHLEHNAIVHGIQDMIMQAIRNVELLPPAAGAEDQPEDLNKIDGKIFASANTMLLIKGDVPCVRAQSVYYNKQILADMRVLAQSALELPTLTDTSTKASLKDKKEVLFTETLLPQLDEEKKPDESWEEGWSWSHNILDLGKRQLSVMSERARAEELSKLDALVEKAVWHEHRPNQLYPLALDAMSELAENIEAMAAQTRRRMGLPLVNFKDPDSEALADPKAAAAAKGKGAPVADEKPTVSPELEKDFRDALYVKVRQLLCDAVDAFADFAGEVVIDEADRRGEDVEAD